MGGEIGCSSRKEERRPEVGRPNLSMVLFLFVAAAEQILSMYYVKYSIFSWYMSTGFYASPYLSLRFALASP